MWKYLTFCSPSSGRGAMIHRNNITYFVRRTVMIFAKQQQQQQLKITTNSSFLSSMQRQNNSSSKYSIIFYSGQQQPGQQQHQHHYEQYIQYRYFDSRKVRKRKKGKNPFKVLAIPEGSLYKDVKRKFLKIAMTNHPDTHSEDLTQEEKDTMRDQFIHARIAFESLVEDPTTGAAILLSEMDALTAEENFDSWFKSETGFNSPFQFDMDPETMKEVAKMTETIGGDSGLDRDGGMWALARMVTSAVKKGGDAASILRLESGDGKGGGRNPKLDGELRRRRRR